MRRSFAAVLALSLPGIACAGGGLPGDLGGTLVFVSDRGGRDALYLRRLPDGADFQLASLDEPVGEPALSHDGRQVAFTMRGRIGIVDVESHAVRFVSMGVDWRDAAPAWRPDGRALAVSSRRGPGSASELHLLTLSPEGPATRRPLLQSEHLDETAPAFSPDGSLLAFIRADNVYRLELASGRTRRLTGGFRLMREPRFLPSGRLLSLWSQGKQFGLDLMDADGANRETLAQGTTFFRTLAPSPDGRHLAVTLGFEAQTLSLRQPEEIRLLDARGRPLGTLAKSWRSGTHSPSWGN